MLKVLYQFLHSPCDFLQDQRRQRIAIISLFSLLFVCVLFAIAKGASRRSNSFGSMAVSQTPLAPTPTQTKWWVRHKPSDTPTRWIFSGQTPIGGSETPAVSSRCTIFATDFKPGTFGYVSLFPPYDNVLRSGAGKNYSTVGFVETGGWVKILAEPVCGEDGYVWLNVQSAASSSSWTAGGHRMAQWVFPCPNPKNKCGKNKSTGYISATPNPSKNGNNNGESGNSNTCVSERLAVGIDAQVSPNDLLVVRSEPFVGSVIGRIAPLDVINIIDGPKCAGGAVWWKVWGPQTGWAVESRLRACPKEGECNPWRED